MSVRVTNCMNRIQTHTIGAFLDYPEDQFLAIRNLGKTSLEEIMRVRAELIDPNSSVFRLTDQINLSKQEKKTAASEDASVPVLLYDLPISELHLSVRAMNCLNREGWTKASQLVGKSLDELLSVKNMGRKTAVEILDAVSALLIRLSGAGSESDSSPQYGGVALLAEELTSVFGGVSGSWLLKLEQLRAGEMFNRNALLNMVFKEAEIYSAQKKAICDYLEMHEDQASVAEIVGYMQTRLADSAYTVSLLDDLSDEGKVERKGSTVTRSYPRAREFAENLQNDRQREILLARFGGKTLEEVASFYGLTRERVRQIQSKAFRNAPRLDEDKYRYVFSTYYFSREDFQLSFNEPEEVFYYLEIATGRKQTDTKPLGKALEDERISVAMRRQIERAVYKKYVTIDGVRVLKKRPELVRYVIGKYCREQTDFNDFLVLYDMVLEDLGLSGDESLEIESRTYENKLNACDYVLWAHGKRLRYYLISEHDYSELVDVVTSEIYQNTELSARLFFLNYPELMEELDIRDEYELHNLLRKICPKDNDRLHFGKNPTITIGTANRDGQVLNLLLQYAPISAQELAGKMEELYGFDPATVIGSYFNNIRAYYHNGVYSISAKPLPPNRFAALRETLMEDYYSIESIQKQYLQLFPEGKSTDINPYTLNTLGFHVYSGYVISGRYSNATDYFTRLLTEHGVTDLDSLNKELTYIGAFSSTLLHLRQSREIIEFEPHRLIHVRRLEAGGITKERLREYCDHVMECVGLGRQFTIHSLRREGFADDLDDLGFGDWFYSSLLCEDERFSSRRVGGTRILYAGKRSFTLEDLLIEILLEREKIEIYELQEVLEEEYGIQLDKYKLSEIVKESSLYYDGIMETVYIDYDTYFEEI